MMIKKIEISNFKSFKKLDLNLGDFNVLIGANASGKSNFTQIFKFLKDIAVYDLDNAISMQGGIEYFRNSLLDKSEEFALGVTISTPENPIISDRKYGLVGVKFNEIRYEFGLVFSKKGLVNYDRLNINVEFTTLGKDGNKKLTKKDTLGTGNLLISRNHNKVEFSPNFPDELKGLSKELFIPFFRKIELPPRTLLLETPYFTPLPPFSKFFDEVAIYDFDPKLPKKAVPITGKTQLEEDGSNLAFVLQHIIENNNKKRKLENLLKDLLPFIDTISVAKFADKSLLFNLKENYNKNFSLPASLISDGTINLTTLIIALYFEECPLAIFEEPERNIHPFLISKMVGMLKDASHNKQIIVTTHNPEIVKHAGIENLLLISRDQEGLSSIHKPSEIKEVKAFLKNDIGIEELYIQNLLGD
jgi:predicted ATPase